MRQIVPMRGDFSSKHTQITYSLGRLDIHNMGNVDINPGDFTYKQNMNRFMQFVNDRTISGRVIPFQLRLMKLEEIVWF